MINQSNENATPTTTVIVISPTDYIIARYYAKQLGWSDPRVRLWTGENRLPGAAVHLINREDWWFPDDGPGSNQPAWLLGSGQSAANVFDALPPGERDYELRSDTHLSEWTVRLAEIEESRLPLNEAFAEYPFNIPFRGTPIRSSWPYNWCSIGSTETNCFGWNSAG